mmetsp:Transcript_52102/g.161687  ORF Transcript_52102/g.161687 Transcript_52102/m.161687 type:complete len:619 (-) Transcript_52102:118-1974(-)
MLQGMRSPAACSSVSSPDPRNGQRGNLPARSHLQAGGLWRGLAEPSQPGPAIAAGAVVVLALRAGLRPRRRLRSLEESVFMRRMPWRRRRLRCWGSALAPVVRRRGTEAGLVVAHASRSGEQSQMGMGILTSISDLPKTEALGIELRASAGSAAPVRMLEQGDLAEDSVLIRHEFGEDVEENTKIVCKTVRDLVQHFNWKGVVGISVTIKIAKYLGIYGEDFVKLERDLGTMLSKTLRGKATFVHTVIHTDGAAYDELVFGACASQDVWRDQLVLVCTLGQHIGAVLFNDGKRVRNSPLNALFTSSWSASISGWMVGSKFTPPQPGTPDFQEWARLIDGHISTIAATVRVDRIIIIPTGRTAGMKGLTEELPPFLDRTREAVPSGAVSVVAPREGACVRGVALCALWELESLQVLRSLNSILDGSQAMHSLSRPQLQMVFDKVDVDAGGALEPEELQAALALLGIQRDIDALVDELDMSRDGHVSFEDFVAWWSKEVASARVVLLTSAQAWRRIIKKVPPEGYGEFVLLEVTFTFCRSCRAFASKFKRYADRYKDVRFVQLVGNSTIGAMELVTKELGVKVSPAFFLFRRGGELLASWTGTDVKRFEKELEATQAKVA